MVDITVSVDCPRLEQLIVYVALPGDGVELVDGSEWIDTARFEDAFFPDSDPSVGDVFNHGSGSTTIQFWLNQDPFSAWRVTAGSGGLFGFSVRGLAVGEWGLSYVQTSARNTTPFPDEDIDASAGPIIVYNPPEPIDISPPGGAYNSPQTVSLASEHSLEIYYTTDGTEPDRTKSAYSAPFELDVSGGGSVTLKVIAYGAGPSFVTAESEFQFDYQAPAVTVDFLPSSSQSPTLTGTVDDAAAVISLTVADQAYSVPNPGDGSWTFDVPAVLPEGIYDVAVTATDPAGNVGQDGTVDELVVDITPPAGAFSIASGNPAYVTSEEVQLVNTVSGATSMRFRDQGGAWSAWIPYAQSFVWGLPAGDGAKAVGAGFRDDAGNVLALSDGVVLDTQRPASSIAVGGSYGPFTWPGEISGTATDSTSGVASVSVEIARQDSGEYWNGLDWQSDPVWLLASGTLTWSYGLANEDLADGVTVQVSSRARDAAGLVEAPPAVESFMYDSSAPEGGFVIGTGDPGYVTAAGVVLDIDVGGAVQMRFRNSGGAWSSWEGFAATKAWVLTAGDGPKLVEGQFRDTVMNILEESDTVVLDTTPPTSSVGTSGGFGPLSWPDEIVGSAEDATSGVASVVCSVLRGSDGLYWDGGIWQPVETWLSANPARGPWGLVLPVAALSAGGDGVTYTVRSRATDTAGNTQAVPGENTFLYDSRVPAGSFTIGAGNPVYTNSRDVVLHNAVSGEHELEMRFAESGGVFSAWVSYEAVFTGLELSNSDGEKTVEGEFRDMISGNTLSTSDTIIMDRIAPTSTTMTSGSFGPATWPGGISGMAGDDRSGVVQALVSVRRSTDDAYWDGTAFIVSGAPIFNAANGTESWFLPLGSVVLTDGATYIVQSRAIDAAGNAATEVVPRAVSYDASPPSGGFTVRAGDPAYTTSTSVTLAVSVTGAVEMSFRNSGGAFGPWEPHSASKSWALTGGDGDKLVEGRFRDAVGNVLYVSDGIVLDAGAPSSGITMAGRYGPVTWGGTVSGTASDVTGEVASVSVEVMRLGDGMYWDGAGWQAGAAWLPAVGTTAWTRPLPAAALNDSESYRVRSRAVDLAGNIEPVPAEHQFVYDATPPAGAFFVGPENPQYTTTSSVILTSAVEGAVEMRFRNDEVRGAFSEWEPYSSAKPWELAGGDGSKTVHAEFRDEVWNILALADEITLDGTAPTSAPAIAANTGPQVWSGALEGTASDATSGVALVEISLARASDGKSWSGSDWLPVEAWLSATGGDVWTYALPVPPFVDGDAITVRSRATDAAGNVQSPPGSAVFVYDATAPSGSFAIDGAEVEFTKSRQVTLSMSVEGASEMRFRNGVEEWGGRDWIPFAPTLSWTLADADGERSVVGQFRDAVFNVLDASDTVVLDRVAPTCTISVGGTQGEGTWTGGVYGSASDDRSGVAEVSVRILRSSDFRYWDGTSWQAGEVWVTASGTASWVVALPFASLDHGATYGIAARATDSAGNVQGTATSGIFTADKVGPAAPIAVPVGGLFNASQSVSLTVDGAAAATFYTLDGNVPDEGSTPYSVPIAVDAAHGETVELRAISYDNVGNPSDVVTETYEFDKQSPSGYSVSFDAIRVNAANAGSVSFTLRDAEVGARYDYTIADPVGRGSVSGEGLVVTMEQTFAGIDVRGLADGVLTLSLVLTDVAGNSGDTATATVPKDTAAPSGYTVTFPDEWINAAEAVAASFEVSGAEIGSTYSFTISDTGGRGIVSGDGTVESAEFTVSPVDVSVLADGVLSLSFVLTDTFGNTGQPATGTAVLDSTVPDAPVLGEATDPVNAETATSFSVAGTGEAGAAVQYRIVDAARGEVSGDGNAAVDGSFAFNGIDVSGLADGELTVGVRQSDAAENTGPWAEMIVQKDTVAPAVVLAAPATGAAVNGTAVIEFTDSEETAPEISVDGEAWTPGESGLIVLADVVGFNALSEGVFTLYLRDTDGAGNTGTDERGLVKDSVAPAGYTAAFEPAQINAASAASAGFSLTGAEAGTRYDYTIADGSGRGSVSGNGMVEAADFKVSPVDVSGLADGALSLSVVLTDAAGNVGVAATAAATKDTSAPAGYTASFPADWINAAEAPAASFSVSGAEPGASYAYTLSDTAGRGSVSGGGTVDAADFTVSPVDVSGLADGMLLLSVVVTDEFGNAGAEATATTMLDASVPDAPILTEVTNPVNASTVSSVTLAGMGEAVASVEYRIADTARTEVTGGGTAGGDGSFSFTGIDLSGLADGELTVTVRQTDAAGNESDWAEQPIGKDTVAPNVVISVPSAGAAVNAGATVEFTDDEETAPELSVDGSAWTSAVSGVTTLGDLAGFQALAEGAFTLYLRDTDGSGNVGTDDVAATKDSIAPSGYTVELAHNPLTHEHAGSTGFTISGAEVGAVYSYEVTDSAAGRLVVSGNGAVVTEIQEIGSLDLSAFSYGDFVVRVTLTDSAGNSGTEAVATGMREESIAIRLKRGWNLVGVPVATAKTVSGLFLGLSGSLGRMGPVWLWDEASGEYAACSGSEPVPAGGGFWILWWGNELQISQNGIPVSLSFPTDPGWHLVSPHIPMPVPGGERLGETLWAWDVDRQVYRRVVSGTTIEPGVGYWLYVPAIAE
jgi:hypothetical protein